MRRIIIYALLISFVAITASREISRRNEERTERDLQTDKRKWDWVWHLVLGFTHVIVAVVTMPNLSSRGITNDPTQSFGEMAKLLFVHFDGNFDGSLDINELTDALQKFDPEETKPVDQLIAEKDKNGDDKLSLEEFMAGENGQERRRMFSDRISDYKDITEKRKQRQNSFLDSFRDYLAEEERYQEGEPHKWE